VPPCAYTPPPRFRDRPDYRGPCYGPVLWLLSLFLQRPCTLTTAQTRRRAKKQLVRTGHSKNINTRSHCAPTVDPSTSIAFPKTIQVPAKVPIPPLTLLGVGVRSVTFIGIKVYSAGLYVDLNNPNLHVRSPNSFCIIASAANSVVVTDHTGHDPGTED
jgi:hypothetical protein